MEKESSSISNIRESVIEENLSRKELKQKFLAKLLHLKNDFKGGIPTEIKHSSDKDSGWKVQKGVWFQHVAIALFDITQKYVGSEPFVSQELHDEASAYYKQIVSKDNPMRRRPTVQADIDEADTIIDKLIAELEQSIA